MRVTIDSAVATLIHRRAAKWEEAVQVELRTMIREMLASLPTYHLVVVGTLNDSLVIQDANGVGGYWLLVDNAGELNVGEINAGNTQGIPYRWYGDAFVSGAVMADRVRRVVDGKPVDYEYKEVCRSEPIGATSSPIHEQAMLEGGWVREAARERWVDTCPSNPIGTKAEGEH